MNKRSPKVISSVLIIFIAFAALSACAAFTRKPAQDVIRERVQAMMDAKIDNNWEKVYDFLSPSFKKTKSKEDFARMSRGIYFTKYAITSIDVQPSGTEAKVLVTYDVNMKGFDFTNNKETQTWFKSGWYWYIDVPVEGKNPLEKGKSPLER